MESSTSPKVPRRAFLRGAGALLAASAISRHAIEPSAASASSSATLPERPNIVIIITDQERQPRHWPEGWAETNLPNRQRLADRGLSFTNAHCNSAMCSPSRSTLFTGLYPAQHGVLGTLTEGGTVSPTEAELPVETQNIAKLLATAGYNVHYRGKWHMSKGADGGDASPEDVAAYGFLGWSPPEAGQDTATKNFGGGCANHDARITAEAVEFINSLDPDDDTPFALVVSLANPHDLLAYPLTWNEDVDGCDNYASVAPECFTQGIELPSSIDEVLLDNYKPTPQVQSRLLLAALGPLTSAEMRLNYVNFYAYLQKVVDEHIGSVIDALEAKPGLIDKTLIIRTSDHGEMGLAHGGLRQKIFNAYEETMNIPLVISNPVLFPQGVESGALASLIDLFPTLATLANVPNADEWIYKGSDLTPIINDAIDNPTNPTISVQESLLFTYDDEHSGAPNGQTIVTEPNHVRCLREGRWKYVMYFDPAGVESTQYELYDLQEDPEELHNCAAPRNTEYFNPTQVAIMRTKLMAKMASTGTAPHTLRLPAIQTNPQDA